MSPAAGTPPTSVERSATNATSYLTGTRSWPTAIISRFRPNGRTLLTILAPGSGITTVSRDASFRLRWAYTSPETSRYFFTNPTSTRRIRLAEQGGIRTSGSSGSGGRGSRARGARGPVLGLPTTLTLRSTVAGSMPSTWQFKSPTHTVPQTTTSYMWVSRIPVANPRLTQNPGY